MSRYIGIDGCKAGWLAVSRGRSGVTWRMFKTIRDVAAAFPGAERILIDCPIGLPSSAAPIRPCDQLARKALGKPRMSSVFPVPCREALMAGGLVEARRINQLHLGRSLGAQTWAISSKIAEVDEFLRADLKRHVVFREIHPEVCFWALAGGHPMLHRKKTRAGEYERLQVLRHHLPEIDDLMSDVRSTTLRKDVQPDDVIDAAVGFVTAEARSGRISTLTGSPSHDDSGFPLEMLYLHPDTD